MNTPTPIQNSPQSSSPYSLFKRSILLLLVAVALLFGLHRVSTSAIEKKPIHEITKTKPDQANPLTGANPSLTPPPPLPSEEEFAVPSSIDLSSTTVSEVRFLGAAECSVSIPETGSSVSARQSFSKTSVRREKDSIDLISCFYEAPKYKAISIPPVDWRTPPFYPTPNQESYAKVEENRFQQVDQQPLSTFSIDVDTASYTNMRRFLNNGQRPPAESIRIEEWINYFSYHYPAPKANLPFSVNTEVTECPWEPEHSLVRIGIKGKEIAPADRPNANLVFLIDVSGSMNEPQKLPLVIQSLTLLTESLQKNDRIAITVYASSSGMVLPSTKIEDKAEILNALQSLRAEGSTNGSMGIQLAYDIAKANFIPEGINRVVLCTDGDFNVGITDQNKLVQLIEEKAKSGVFLSLYGFGMGNLNDAALEKLADKGNGHYGYIDSEKEARKTFVDRLSGNLQTIAKDVKIQVEFNPQHVAGYRLIGYENRLLVAQDFNNDKIDAGEIGAGHCVTALYELVPAGKTKELNSIDPLKYQLPSAPLKQRSDYRSELMTVKLRYKQPNGDQSALIEVAILEASKKSWKNSSDDTRFAAAVASLGMLLKDSPEKGKVDFKKISSWTDQSISSNQKERQEFFQLIQKATLLLKESSG